MMLAQMPEAEDAMGFSGGSGGWVMALPAWMRDHTMDGVSSTGRCAPFQD